MFMARAHTAASLALSISLFGAACVGHFDGDVQPPATTGGNGGSGPMAPPPGKPDDPITGPIASVPGPSSRLVRLNHKQWANTVGDLFRLGGPAAQARSFLSESPHVLHRTELSTTVVGGKVLLDDYAVASRLSYGLANTMSDDQLLAAAAARKLHAREDVLAHAQRLLGSPRGQETLRDFHEQLFHTTAYPTVKRDPLRQPAFTPGLGEAMKQESATFID